MVEKKAKEKGFEVDISEFLRIDKVRSEKLRRREDLKHRLNEISKKAPPSDTEIAAAKKIKEELAVARDEFRKTDGIHFKLWKEIPNIPADDVPVGASEEENVVTKEWGEKPKFDFQPKTHWEIAESRGFIDKERAAKVAGSRFAYIKGDLARLQFALIQFVVNSLTNEDVLKKVIQDFELKNVSSKPFIPVLPPAMIRSEVFEAMDRLEPKEERYRVGGDEDNLWLQGSAEHTIGPMHMGEIIAEDDLPLRYLGYLTSFRREAGSYGKDIEGIIRMHQFDKLEMEAFTLPEDGLNEHFFMIAIQEYLMQQLGLPYHVLNKCTADIGKPNARGIDLEVWLPGHKRYLETHTADFMTDYQARRLQTRFKKIGEGGMDFVHMNDATAMAMGRSMVGIIENYQTAGGKISIPHVLRSYMGGQLTL